jgi:hypothetical protein
MITNGRPPSVPERAASRSADVVDVGLAQSGILYRCDACLLAACRPPQRAAWSVLIALARHSASG